MNCCWTLETLWTQEAAGWAGAIATLLAVLVAMFQAPIREWYLRPKLGAKLRLSSPDCMLTPVLLNNRPSNAYYFRLWIENSGRQMAEDTQVFVARVLRRDHTDNMRLVDGFLPMNLKWSHRGSVHEHLTPGMGRHCDLGNILNPGATASNHEVIYGTHRAEFKINVEVEPFTQSHVLTAGFYHIELKLAANNAPPVTHVVELYLTGEWRQNEEAMFREGVTARVLDTPCV